LENIGEIEREMGLPGGRRNNELLDSMLSFNKFFVILDKGNPFFI